LTATELGARQQDFLPVQATGEGVVGDGARVAAVPEHGDRGGYFLAGTAAILRWIWAKVWSLGVATCAFLAWLLSTVVFLWGLLCELTDDGHNDYLGVAILLFVLLAPIVFLHFMGAL
jgi:hypothetical protein